MLYAIVAILALALGAGTMYLLQKYLRNTMQLNAQDVLKNAKLEAESITKEAKLKAKDELIKIRDEFETSTKDRRKELQDIERRVDEREKNLERKMDLIQKRLDDISTRDARLAEQERLLTQEQERLKEQAQKQMVRLEAIASMSRDQARVQLMQTLEQELINERGTLIRRHLEELKQKCQQQAQTILVETMQRYSSECAYDRTTATVPLPSDEMKGRIIGREGRNIRVFESITGVNVLIDDTPSAVVITCFDPVRREVARLALERLVADGRIHPTRVEEVVAKAQEDVEGEVLKAGEDAIQELQLGTVAIPLVTALGRLRFRYSYTQNVLQHSLETAHFMSMIAAELGLDSKLAKRMGLFHDIGKAMDHNMEGSHAIIGMNFLKRNGEAPEVCNAVGCHHGEVAPQSVLASLTGVADALSASRPGARSETTEIYLQRLEKLEEIGLSYEGVELCYAVQAGREIRIVVQPDKINENQALTLSHEIAQRVEKEMQYPGQIKVCVIREVRAIEYAK